MGRTGGGCSYCARPSRRGHGRLVIGQCACGRAVCDHHGKWLDGEVICPRCVKALPEAQRKSIMRTVR